MPWAQSKTEQGGGKGEARDPSKANRWGCSHPRGLDSFPAKSALVSMTCVSWESLQQRMAEPTHRQEGSEPSSGRCSRGQHLRSHPQPARGPRTQTLWSPPPPEWISHAPASLTSTSQNETEGRAFDWLNQGQVPATKLEESLGKQAPHSNEAETTRLGRSCPGWAASYAHRFFSSVCVLPAVFPGWGPGP